MKCSECSRHVMLVAMTMALAITPRVGFATEVAEVLNQGAIVQKECRSLSDESGYVPAATVNLSPYGGWSDRRTSKTGFFHAAKLDGRWWVIDPEGCVFLSIGINSVVPPASQRVHSQDSGDLLWGEETFQKMRAHGLSTLGCWSAAGIATKVSRPMPYCLRWNFMAEYRRQRRVRHPVTDTSPVIFPFDPEFAECCDRLARSMETTKRDPWLFGHFSDNELPLHEEGIVEQYLDHPHDDPNHKAAASFMASRSRDKPTKDDDRDFLRLVVDTYYRTVASAIRKHDPNHMFLGSRFHGRALSSPSIFEAAGQHADIVSVNYYHRWTPESQRIEEWARLARKPILITEWYAMAVDSGLPTEGVGAGFAVRCQRDRARFYQHFTLTLLENPACVGWHWFRYRDGRNNAGLVNAEEEPYEELWAAMREINTQAYPLAAFLQTK